MEGITPLNPFRGELPPRGGCERCESRAETDAIVRLLDLAELLIMLTAMSADTGTTALMIGRAVVLALRLVVETLS